MLDPREHAEFDGLVTRLRATDPRFCRRVERMGRPKTRLYRAAAILLWTAASLCVLLGGWTGAFFAVLAAGYGARLYAKRNGNAPQPIWWTATRSRRTGPAIT